MDFRYFGSPQSSGSGLSTKKILGSEENGGRDFYKDRTLDAIFFSLDENEIVLSCWGWEGWNTMHASTQMRSGRNEVKR